MAYVNNTNHRQIRNNEKNKSEGISDRCISLKLSNEELKDYLPTMYKLYRFIILYCKTLRTLTTK